VSPLEKAAQDKAVHNEQAKLLATFLNGVGLAIFAVGGLAPIFATAIRLDAEGFIKVGVSVLCFAMGFICHVGASRTLRRLKP
jgi:hypothetical protein